MSEALTPDAPATSLAGSAVAETTPSDGTAVESGSAGATAEMVEASRFNGLMAAHQRTLAALDVERANRTALEARLNTEETPPVSEATDATLTELQQLRNELRAERLEGAKAQALADFPEAKPLADLIVGNTPEEIRGVAEAIAQRLQAITTPVPTGDEAAAAAEAAAANAGAPPAAEAAPVAPVVAGGSAPPSDGSAGERVKQALDAKDWTAYWQAKSGDEANLA